MKTIDFAVPFVLLVLAANNVLLFIQLKDSQRREEEWKAEAYKVLEAIEKL